MSNRASDAGQIARFNSGPIPGHKEAKWSPLLLVLPLLFYLALPSRNFYWDGVAFAINIEKRLPVTSLLQPSHLGYTLWGAWLYRLSETVGIHTRALFIMQAANSVLAGFCVVLLYVCLRLRNVPVSFSVPMALIFGFSATWWKFATDANAYVPSIFLLLCAAVLIEHPRTAVLAGLAQAGAALFHELAILFLIVALVRLRKSHRSMAAYASAAIIPSALAFVVAYIVVSSNATLPGFLSWLTSHSPDSGFSFNPITNLAFSVRGTFRLLIGGKLGDFVGDGISKAALAALVIAVVSCAAGWWRAVRMRTRVSVPPLDLIVWVGNFLFLVYPESRPQFNAPLRFALDHRNVWPPGTPILFHRFHPDLWTISYFSPQAAWIGIEEADLGQLERDLAYARTEKKPLWMEATAYDLVVASPYGQRWLAVHEVPSELLEFRDAKHEFRFHCLR